MSTPFIKNPQATLKRRRVGEMPLFLSLSKRLGIRELLSGYIKAHANEKISTVDTLLLLVYNITSGRQPLYELEQWVLGMDSRLFGCPSFEQGVFNDDRFGRALDKLYEIDRASLMTEVAITVVKTFGLDLSRIHNDSTSVKAYGKIGGKTRTGLFLARGKSKDHRPDLKQLVFSLTVSADGAVPIHYKTYPGNTTDDTTHIETWNCISRITGMTHFLYVADCKVCTSKQLSHIVNHRGRVVTIIPETWSEVKTFKTQLLANKKQKKIIWRIPIPGHYGKFETFSCFVGKYFTTKSGYPIHWIHSTEKKKRDYKSREQALAKTEEQLGHLTAKLNTRKLKIKSDILERVDDILDKNRVVGFYRITLSEVKEKELRQIGKGRPGTNTKYQEIITTCYSLSWTRNRAALSRARNIDGIFPILCTDPKLSAKAALKAYKYQPNLEKRFSQLKGVENVAPLLFKKIQRVEAIMFLFFLALILQAALEREVRKKMKQNKIESLPVYPEHRIAYHPTTAKIVDRFHDLSTYELENGDQYQDQLSDLHQQILGLLNIQYYWPC